MPAYVDGEVRVSVPATSANLGPGFDALGLALSLRDELAAEVTDGGLRVDVDGAGAADVPRDESHLVVRSMRAAFEALGGQPAGLRLRCHNVIPHSRGLGSSSAAIVAGLALARALVIDGGERLDDDAMFRLAADLEGHPDNVAPALYGGFVVSGQDDDRFWAANAPVAPSISAVAFVPPNPVETKVARGLLPDVVPHADAAANAGRAALLVAALGGRPDLLLLGTRDRLHQDYREPAMPQSLELVRALRGDGYAAIVSGAGPTVLVLTTGDGELAGRCPQEWQLLELALDTDGVTVL